MDLVYRGFDELPGRAVCLPSLACLEVLDEVRLALVLEQLAKAAKDEDIVLTQRSVFNEEPIYDLGDFKDLVGVARG